MSIDNLISEWQTWCDTNGFPQMSADDLLFEMKNKLSEEQSKFIMNFIERWDRAMDEE